MQGITPKKEYEPPVIEELHVIDPKRISSAPVRMDPRSIRKKRNFAQSAILFLACVGAGFFAGAAMVGAVLLYCLQVGPI